MAKKKKPVVIAPLACPECGASDEIRLHVVTATSYAVAGVDSAGVVRLDGEDAIEYESAPETLFCVDCGHVWPVPEEDFEWGFTDGEDE